MARVTAGRSSRLQLAGSADPGRITATSWRAAASFQAAASDSATGPCGLPSQTTRPTGPVPRGITATAGRATSAPARRTTSTASAGPASGSRASGSSAGRGCGGPDAGTSPGIRIVATSVVIAVVPRRMASVTRSPGSTPAKIPAAAARPSSGVAAAAGVAIDSIRSPA